MAPALPVFAGQARSHRTDRLACLHDDLALQVLALSRQFGQHFSRGRDVAKVMLPQLDPQLGRPVQ
jgi:hypothetical protein